MAWSGLQVIVLLIYSVTSLENGLARTPPMGWMSWTAFYCEMDCIKHPHSCINEQLYMDMADRMIEDGYADVGYRNVHVDDCWMERVRDSKGKLVSDQKRFPSGMKALAKYMHDRGLNFGIYEDYGTKTCAGFPGSYGYIQMDANTFAEWDVDYLKLDGCNIDTELMPRGYPEMERALNATGRQIVYSCSWPAYLIDAPAKVDYKVIAKSCNLWRNFDDINSSWKSIKSIIDYYDRNQDKHIPAHGPGQWNDPDMLVIGNPGITEDMSITQMSIWSIWSAPLIMSNDLRKIPPTFVKILQNQDVIAVNQDPMGVMGRLVANTTDIGVYVKAMNPIDSLSKRTSFAVAVLNRNERYKNLVEFKFADIGLTSATGYQVRDLWTGHSYGIMKPDDIFQTVVNATGTTLIKATLTNGRKYEWFDDNHISI